MTTNGLFILYSTLASVYPTLILNFILLPINATRFFQMKRLIKQVNEAANGDLSLDWLKPFTTKKHFAAGTTMFHKGDPASELHFIMSGRYRVVENRRAAIGAALSAAGPGDAVVIAGKGHETTQTTGGRVEPFDDRVVARAILAERGFHAGA